jgi:putative endonuclease
MNRTPRQQRRLFQRCYYVYLLANLRGNLYTGLTDDLRKRILQHKNGTFDGFTKKYNINRLMYFETYNEPRVAANRELQIKKFRREKKIALFRESNPQWKDLTPEIFLVSFGHTEPRRPLSKSRTRETLSEVRNRGLRDPYSHEEF